MSEARHAADWMFFPRLDRVFILSVELNPAGVRGRRAVRNLLRHSAPERHGPAPDDVQDVQKQVR